MHDTEQLSAKPKIGFVGAGASLGSLHRHLGVGRQRNIFNRALGKIFPPVTDGQPSAVPRFGVEQSNFVTGAREGFGQFDLRRTAIGVNALTRHVRRDDANGKRLRMLDGAAGDGKETLGGGQRNAIGGIQFLNQRTQHVAETAASGQLFKAVLNDALCLRLSGGRAEKIFDALGQFVERCRHVIHVGLERRGDAARFADDQRALGDAEQRDAVPLEIFVHTMMEVQQNLAALRQAHRDQRVHVGGLAGNHRARDRGLVEKAVVPVQSRGVPGEIFFAARRAVAKEQQINRAAGEGFFETRKVAHAVRQRAGFLDERELGDLLQHRRIRHMAERQVVAGIAALADAERGIKINVPDRSGTLEMFHGQCEPVGGRLLGVEKNQVGGSFPGQLFSGAEFKKFMGSNHQMPVGLGREAGTLVAKFHRVPKFFEAGADEVADFVEEIISLRTRVQHKARRRGRVVLIFVHGVISDLTERFSGRLFLQADEILVVVPAFFLVGDQFQIRQRDQLRQHIRR